MQRKLQKEFYRHGNTTLMQALYAPSDKNLADEILLVVKLILRDGMAKSSLERMRFLTRNVPGELCKTIYSGKADFYD